MAKDTGIVNIHGREYTTVAKRVQMFREKHPDWLLQTELVSRDAECVVMKASIAAPDGRIIATGHAEEYRKASTINKTSALENAETSAIGRALAAMGLGGSEFASADEVAQALHLQSKGVHKPTDGAWDHVSKERGKVLHDTAVQVKDALAEGKDFDAYALCETIKDSEEKVAIWTLFDSKERRRLKEAAQQELATA